jgi:hypothetical protein
MALKDWKKTVDETSEKNILYINHTDKKYKSKALIIWSPRKPISFHKGMSHLLFGYLNSGLNTSSYRVEVLGWDDNNIQIFGLQKEFKTKEKALKYAKEYMSKH